MPIKEEFPLIGMDYSGGKSDGREYQTVFSGATLQHLLEMIKAFLAEEGYEDLPLPADAQELELFRTPTDAKGQVMLFGGNGYVHYPIKILFLPPKGRMKNLLLCIFNEKAEKSLLRFHGKLVE